MKVMHFWLRHGWIECVKSAVLPGLIMHGAQIIGVLLIMHGVRLIMHGVRLIIMHSVRRRLKAWLSLLKGGGRARGSPPPELFFVAADPEVREEGRHKCSEG